MKSCVLFVSFILLNVVLLTNCQTEVGPTANLKEIWPLKVGNFWIWSNTDYDSLGLAVDIYLDTILVKNEYVADGLKYYGIRGADTTVRWADACYQNRKDGLYSLNFWQIIDGSKVRDSIGYSFYLKFPGSAGDNYISKIGAYPDTIKIEKTDTIFNLNIGSFTCYKYIRINSKYNTEKDISYYSPGIGKIASEYYKQMQNGNNYLQNKSLLVEYYVK